MKSRAWLMVLSAFYAVFVGMMFVKYEGDSALAYEGRYIRPHDRASNPVELTMAALDRNKSAWNSLTARIDAEESNKLLPAGPLNLARWLKDQSGIHGLAFMPFILALILVSFLACIAGSRVYDRIHPNKSTAA